MGKNSLNDTRRPGKKKNGGLAENGRLTTRQRKNALLVGGALLAGMVLLLVVLLLPGKTQTENVSSQPYFLSEPPQRNTSALASVVLPPPISQVESAAEPAASVVEQAAPTGERPQLAFTEEELAVLTGMLDSWAEQSEESEEDGHNVALYFYDLDTGVEFVYNSDKVFFIASLVKAPHAMYMYHLVDSGQASLDEAFTITQEFVEASRENSGKIKDEPDLPKDYTLEELIFYMLGYSDTAAQRAILQRYPAMGYSAYAAGLGLHRPQDVRGVTSGNITAPDAGVYLKSLYSYMEFGPSGSLLKTKLMETRNRMIRSEYPVARKYGWDVNAYHDMAVVYTPHPYLLAILTDKSAGTAAETAEFGKISRQIEAMMQPKWQQLDAYLQAGA